MTSIKNVKRILMKICLRLFGRPFQKMHWCKSTGGEAISNNSCSSSCGGGCCGSGSTSTSIISTTSSCCQPLHHKQ